MSQNNACVFSVLKRPYEAVLEDNLSMYDRLPYRRDAELCNKSTLALVSGNLIKYYRCASQEMLQVNNQDENFAAILAFHKKEEEIKCAKRAARKSAIAEVVEESIEDEE